MVKVADLENAILHPEVDLLPGQTVHITEEQVKTTLTVRKTIELANEAYRKLSTQQTISPERIWLTTLNGTSLYCMPSHIIGRRTISVKIARFTPDNAERSLPSVMATIYVYDASTGQELARIEAETLTTLRTAASSAVATKLLARPDAKVLGIFGTGRQAEAHIQAIREVRRIEKVVIYSRTQSSSEAFARKASRAYDIPAVAADSPEEVVESSDILVLATNSKLPLFSGELVRPRTHVNAIGAALPDTREMDTALVKRATVVVDSKPQALSSYGDILIPLKEGAINETDVTELGKLLVHPIVIKKREQITVFKAGGVAVLDAVVADYLLSPWRKWKTLPQTTCNGLRHLGGQGGDCLDLKLLFLSFKPLLDPFETEEILPSPLL